tara:strand:- start:42 stop:239 length:198 start_codon:yes stop_codon:yes gene_type:complete
LHLFLENLFLKKLNMKKIDSFVWLIWFLLVMVWNYSYPAATPFLDVLVAVILSILNIIILKFIKK